MPLPLDATLRQIQRQTEEENAAALASRLGLQYGTLDTYPFDLKALSIIPLAKVEENLFACLIKTPHRIKVAVVHPESEETVALIHALAAELGVDVEMAVVSNSSMTSLIKSYIHLLEEAKEEAQAATVEAQKMAQKDYFSRIQSLDDFRTIIKDASVTEILDVVLAAGYTQHASDIHLEPTEKELTVRFRIDGVLQPVVSIPMEHHHSMISRIKMQSNLKLDQTKTIQDGRFSLSDRGINADVRVSTIPTAFGEGVVLRILRQDMQRASLVDLGFTEENLAIIHGAITKPYGLILVTGPTGSGKSTTLYAMLDILNTSERKIITLEDPVEYRVAGLQQSQISPDQGFTFAEGLRGALRQDPDVVMVGEIRDPETATIALNASLTGHLVLSTLHTNNAVTAATRFLEMGIAPFLLNGSIQLIIAQRLVRKLVPGCDPANPKYEGRVVIAEVLKPNQEFEQGILQHMDQGTLQDIALRGGMKPIYQDGLTKVRNGLTTQDELMRVTEV